MHIELLKKKKRESCLYKAYYEADKNVNTACALECFRSEREF